MTDSSKQQVEQLIIDDNDGSPRAVEASCEPSNLTPPEPSDIEAIDRIAAYLRRNGYAEVTIWESGGAVYRQDHLHDALARAERERDEARRTSATRIAEAAAGLDAYDAIRQSLGFAPDTDPQEVVDAVGRMRATVEKLPLTADGVPVAPEDDLFHIDSHGRVLPVVAHVIDGESIIHGISGFIMMADCYSTQAAAEAAQRKEGE